MAGNVTGAQISGNSVTVSASGPTRPPVVRLAGTLGGVVMSNNQLTSNRAGPDYRDPRTAPTLRAILKPDNQMSGP